MGAALQYEDFLKTKDYKFESTGFDADNLNEALFDFQKFVVRRALKKGRYAIFADCGLGKTLMQLEWSHQVVKHTNRPVLILAPLAVSGQTKEEGSKFGISVSNTIGNGKIHITNYEQIDNIDLSIYAGVVLDESSILKNYNGAIKNNIIEKTQHTRFKLACTATPSPNDELELGNHAEFLGVMTSQDMRAIFFTTDKSRDKQDKYRLKKHAIKDFYRWVFTWSIMFSNPSDIGFDGSAYILPKLNIIEHRIETDKQDNGMLFNTPTVSATDINKELKRTIDARIKMAVDLVNHNPERNFIVWGKLNIETDTLEKQLSDSLQVSGSQPKDTKEKRLLGFARNEFRILVTKPSIGAWGLNYQNCGDHIVVSPDFSFETLYQMMRRSWRFGRKGEVNIHMIITDTMQNVIESFYEKQEKFIQMQNEMRLAFLENIKEDNEIADEVEVSTGKYFELWKDDAISRTKKLESNSIDYSFFSPPFGSMFVFSDDKRDMSNVRNNDEFFRHFEYLVPELLRVTKEGRLLSMHIMQSTTLLGRDGYYSIVDFRGDLIRLFQKHGWIFHAENMIRKDPKTAAIRTKNHQLMHGTTKRDSAIVRPGLADYIITFRKPGENKEPIRNDIPFDLWCKIAEPVWLDIDESDTLQYRTARDEKDERHLTPTQLTPIRWCYMMWSNKGDTIYCPFTGIGSEGWEAIQMERLFKGCELKGSYFDNAGKNLKVAEEMLQQQTLFELAE